jgi:hypothetical protein
MVKLPDHAWGQPLNYLPREHYPALLQAIAPRVIVHNQVVPTRVLGSRGFRAWVQPMDDRIEPCPCEWARELGTHYRVTIVWKRIAEATELRRQQEIDAPARA